MYRRLLDTFIITADAGSFTKAARQLYISPSAVLQHVNSLEDELGVKLLNRSAKGIELTEAGRYLYEQTLFIKQWSAEVRDELARLDTSKEKRLIIGVPKLHKSYCLYQLWPEFEKVNNGYRLDYAELSIPGQKNIIDADLVEFVNVPVTWQKNYSFLQLGLVPVVLGVPEKNPLSGCELVKDEAMKAQRVFINQEAFERPAKECIEYLSASGAEICFCRNYDNALFDRCVMTGDMVLLAGCSYDLRPDIKIVRGNWDVSLPYGFFYKEGAEEFIEYVRRALSNGSFIFESRR